jgi:hypothetical protein
MSLYDEAIKTVTGAENLHSQGAGNVRTVEYYGADGNRGLPWRGNGNRFGEKVMKLTVVTIRKQVWQFYRSAPIAERMYM